MQPPNGEHKGAAHPHADVDHADHTHAHETAHAADPIQAAADAHAANGHAADEATSGEGSDTMMATVATIGVVGVGALVLEAALIPGIVLGVAAVLAPTYMPRLGAAINPLLRSGVRGALKFGHKTREVMAEAQEHLHDIAAEVEAEKDAAIPDSPPKASAGHA